VLGCAPKAHRDLRRRHKLRTYLDNL